MMSSSPRVVGTALLPGGLLGRAVLHIAAGRIEGVELEPPAIVERALRRDGTALVLSDREVLAPAFVDVHCHGAGGGSAHGATSQLQLMAETLLTHGVGSFLATTVTAPIPDLMVVAHRVARLVASQVAGQGASRASALLGLHLEGPALSPIRSAGHDQDALVSPALLASSMEDDREAWGAVRAVTLAPELAGGLELVRRLAGVGTVASVGHTDADAAVATEAYEAGARSTTHLFSGMPPLHHRAPGPVGAALISAPFIELICDGIHVDARLLPPIARAIGGDRLVLVSDALPLAGSRLRRVSMPGGTARIQGDRAVDPDGSLAGSRLLLDGMVARAVHSGIPLSIALRAATENPARLLDLRDRGTLTPGAIADFVVMSRGGRLKRVLAGGAEAQPDGLPGPGSSRPLLA